jgi:hypothetical protein
VALGVRVAPVKVTWGDALGDQVLIGGAVGDGA